MISVDDGAGAECRGQSIVDWHERFTFRWDLTNWNNQRVQPGWYVLHVEAVYDENNPGANITLWEQRLLPNDVETCWDDPSHNTLGQHRLEVPILIDGATAFTRDDITEKATEPVPTCSTALQVNDRIKCTCAGGDPWPCPLTPNGNAGGSNVVRYFDPSLDGAPGAMRVQYCPTGACP